MAESVPSPERIYKLSPETRAKMSASAKRRANTPEGKAILSRNGTTSFKGRTHTEETRAVIRAKRAEQVITRESLEKTWNANRGRPSANKGIPATKETRLKISAGLRAKRDILSQKGKARYARETPEQRAKRLIPWIEAGQKNIPFVNTSIEVFVAQQLDLLGVVYETQKRIGYYIVDIFVPANNLIINVDGCYWHGCERCGFNSPTHLAKRTSDRKRYWYLVNKGYTVKSIWEHSVDRARADETQGLRFFESLGILGIA